MKSKKLFELQSQTEKNKLSKKAPEQSFCASLNDKLSETYNNLETNEIAKCEFEVLMSAREGCSGLINIDSGANCLILRLCSWFEEINKNAKSHLSTENKFDGLSVDGVGSFGNFDNVKWPNSGRSDFIQC